MLPKSARRMLSGFMGLLVIGSSFVTLTPVVPLAYAVAAGPVGGAATTRAPVPSVAADTEPPSSPEALTATAYPGYILIDWYAASDDTDVTGYLVLRDGQPLALVNSGTLSYRDITAHAGMSYRYSVQALDAAGNHSVAATTERVSASQAQTPFMPIPMNSPSASVRPAKAAAAGYSSKLRRYPYLTDVVATYATINWATDTSSASSYATWGKVGSESCTAHTVTATKHSITVNAITEYQWLAQLTLTRDTQYCYRVFLGASPGEDLLGTDASPAFWTQIPAGLSKPFSFAVLGDWGDVDNAAADQANVMQQIAQSGARFALTTGDNSYPAGSQTNYGDLVQTGTSISANFGPQFWTLPGRSIPLYPASGNHGLSSTSVNHPELLNWPQTMAAQLSNGRYQTETYGGIDGITPKTYPSAWYAFDAGIARFYVLDAAWDEANIGTASSPYQVDYDYHWTPSSAEYQWLVNDLATHPAVLKFAFFHYPLYSDNKQQNSDAYLQGTNGLEGLLISNGVDLVFNGHAHTYERNVANGLTSYVLGATGTKLQPVDGGCSSTDAYALGWSPTKLKVSTCGAATANPPSDATGVYNFVLVSVNGTTVTVTPIDEMGRVFDQQVFQFTSSGDTTSPSTPANVTATAPTATEVDLTWTAATDNVGVTGYDIYRNGTLLTTVGAVTSDSDMTVSPATTYQYQVLARDAAGNISALSDPASVTTPAAIDTTPPSTPTNLTATAPTATEVDLTWTAATDNVGVTGYDIYRNGTLLTTVGAVTSYSDLTVSPATTYQYQVLARDAAGNTSPLSSAASVTTPAAIPAVFRDGFESGNLSAWTVSAGLTVQTAVVHTGVYAAQANTTAGNTYAKKTLPATYTDGYGRLYFNLLSYSSQVNLLRFRTATDASIGYLFVSTAGKLGLRNDVVSTTLTSATVVGSGWHALELHATINGAASTTEVWLDGVKVSDLSLTTNLGTTAIGKVQIGEVQSGRTYNLILDDAVFDIRRIGL